MEKKLLDAAKEGNVNSLIDLLQEDALLLDRFITGRYPETPLHVASMLGHVDFVDQLLTHKPELAKELNCRNSSPLHLATAKGYLDIVRRLLQVNSDLCLVPDLDGRNPPHIAAIKGHLDVLRELVNASPWAARLLMDKGETILHACVRDKQLEALKLLLETVSDHEFLNCKNYDSNTILHLAIADKQTETINFLISSTTVDVNCQNADGFTALDLLSQNQRDGKDKKIVESLRRMRANRTKDKPLSNRQLKAARTKILASSCTSNRTKAVSKPTERADWLERKRNTLIVVASLLATMAFQAGVNPPGGVWQDNAPTESSSTASSDTKQDNAPTESSSTASSDTKQDNAPTESSSTASSDTIHKAGLSIMACDDPTVYTIFIISNTVGFLASLSTILLLISGLPLRHRFFMWFLMVIMWVAITAMAVTYLVSISNLANYPWQFNSTEGHIYQSLQIIPFAALLGWIGFMLLILLGHTIRLAIRLIKFLLKSAIRSVNIISRRR